MTAQSNTAGTYWPLALALVAVIALLGGCSTGQRLQQLSDRAADKWLNKPVTEAMTELGVPQRQRPLADLREYTWSTGVQNEPGGNCTLALVADKRGVVVDYRMDGTPRGCDRLIGSA
jgi:hypothetical protein